MDGKGDKKGGFVLKRKVAVTKFLNFVLRFSQASDMINAILEGYPKSKKEFLVSESSS